MVERSVSKLCGYPICENPLTKVGIYRYSNETHTCACTCQKGVTRTLICQNIHVHVVKTNMYTTPLIYHFEGKQHKFKTFVKQQRI